MRKVYFGQGVIIRKCYRIKKKKGMKIYFILPISILQKYILIVLFLATFLRIKEHITLLKINDYQNIDKKNANHY